MNPQLLSAHQQVEGGTLEPPGEVHQRRAHGLAAKGSPLTLRCIVP
jgi:hypothetical protein